jgi:hypothetical protein
MFNSPIQIALTPLLSATGYWLPGYGRYANPAIGHPDF